MTSSVVRTWRRWYGTGRVVTVERQVRNVGLSTIIQPAYSPELNPVKRLFEEVRRWVEGRIYGSVEGKMEAVEAYLSELETDPERVRSLTAWSWIERTMRNLPTHYATSSH